MAGDKSINSLVFKNSMPPDRLGTPHSTIDSFFAAVYSSNNGTPTPRPKKKEYSLVVVTESRRRRILLGLKHRGFGSGFYNCFGGKLEKNEDPATGAVRELHEEANIKVELDVMNRSEVGILHFTFEDDDEFEMVVHLFRVDVTCAKRKKTTSANSGFTRGNVSSNTLVDPETIHGCDEITPEWFDDWTEIPLHNMFADDSIWLTRLLSEEHPVQYENLWFHFQPGGQSVNSVKHFFASSNGDIFSKHAITHKPNKELWSGGCRQENMSLEKRLFHDLHSASSPSIKEFKESYAFVNAIRKYFGSDSFDTVIDVAGGHGMIAALLLTLTSAKHAVVIDPAKVGGITLVQDGWRKYFEGKELRYRHECLRTGLPTELESILASKKNQTRVLICACHACQHLSDETLQIATKYGVHVAVMPCCQKDHTDGSWKALSKSLGITVGAVMDIVVAGKMMAWDTGRSSGVTYQVRMKQIDEKITPQNRLVMCKATYVDGKGTRDKVVEKAHKKLRKAYDRAHRNKKQAKEAHDLEIVASHDAKLYVQGSQHFYFCSLSILIGFFAGVLTSAIIVS